MMDRYRVKTGSKTWTDSGPDLLRTADGALAQVRAVFAGAHGKFTVRVDGAQGTDLSREQWVRLLKRGEFDLLVLKHGRTTVSVKREKVKLLPVERCSRGVEVLWSLVKHQFPNVLFAGGYVWKEVAGTSSWSDHAWGTAVDLTPRGKGVDNDGLFDWLVRMAKASAVDYDYAIGSKKGRVHSASASEFAVRPGGGDDSHLWHNHVSVVDHDGRRPPREGGA